MSTPHALVFPWPAQGHIVPLMHLSHFLADNGFKITFVNTQRSHDRITSAGAHSDRFNMVSIPDGFGPERKRLDPRLIDQIEYHMPAELENLITKINEEGEVKITCLIADGWLGWVMEVAERMGLQSVAFWPTLATLASSYINISKLKEIGVVDENGSPTNEERFKLAPTATAIDQTYFVWNFIYERETQQRLFRYFEANLPLNSKAHFIICNSFQDFEIPTFTNFPNIIPIGPLPLQKAINPLGHFWSDDPTCINWLDQQPVNSVVYVAFGSTTSFDLNQLKEFAFALESSQMCFLWVTRPGVDEIVHEHHEFLKQFQESIKGRGKIVNWCNQEKVLAHPSIACFVSHCGWNSALDGVRNGVPFLFFPFLADQLAIRGYLCDEVKVGLNLVKNKDGIVTREEIKSKLVELLGSEEIKARVRRMKELAQKSISEGGSSFMNLYKLVEALKK